MMRVYFGHHKCASQYVKAIFLQTTALLGMKPSRVDNFSAELPLGYHMREPYVTLLQKHRAKLLTDPAPVVCLTNGDREAVSLLEQRGDYRGFHVIRDPRDVLVSAYFSHRYSHPIRSDGGWIAEFRRQLNAAPDVESGLLLELEFSDRIFSSMGEWHYANPHIYETRFETLIINPVAEFTRIFSALDIQVPRWGLLLVARLALDFGRSKYSQRPMPLRTTLPLPVLRRIVARHAFERLTQGRQPGQEDTQHHYRKGVAGDWHSYFTPRVTAAFKERYGALLIDLDYEKNTNW